MVGVGESGMWQGQDHHGSVSQGCGRSGWDRGVVGVGGQGCGRSGCGRGRTIMDVWVREIAEEISLR